MERQLLKEIVAVAKRLVERSSTGRAVFSDLQIVRVFYWAVLHDRPLLWACDSRNWPLWDRRQPLPSPSTMSRRLRSPSVRMLLDQVEAQITRPKQGSWVWIIDGKPLAIGGSSKDRQAGYGRAASGKAKGYKLHALIGIRGEIAAWRLTPMNKDERVMARRLLRQAEIQGYVLADANYDDNQSHDVCVLRGNVQLVTPRRYSHSRGLGHHRHSAGRLRCLQMLDAPQRFAWSLLEHRDNIERYFGNMTSFGGGLTHLPPWVRTHRRVHRWVQAKLVIHAARRQYLTTYAA